MKDYEQLYYDSQYEIKKLKKQVEFLEEELLIYKNLQKNADIKEIIIKDFTKYLKNKKGKKDD